MRSAIPNESSADAQIRAVDAVFEQAGLQRHSRASAGIASRRLRFERTDKSDLSPAPTMPRTAANGVRWFSAPGWERHDWLWHGFSTRQGGRSRAYCAEGAEPELNLGFTPEDDREAVVANRRLLAEAVSGDPATPLATIRQIHSNLMVRVGLADAGRDRAAKGDGLLTDEPGLLLGVLTADCIPVLVADRKRRAVGAFHAGWRGTVKHIVESGVGRMRIEFGSDPADLTAVIGPGIGVCCYSVGEEVLSSFESQFAYARDLFCEVDDADEVRRKYPMLFLTQRAPGHSPMGPSLHLNLAEANRRQLLAAGVRPEAIHLVGGCTGCQPRVVLFAPELAGPRGAHDERDRNRARLSRRSGGGFGGFLGVDQVAKLFGRLEVRHTLGGDFHLLAGFGVPPDARIALANAEGAEAADLDLVAALERPDHGVEDGLDDDLAVAARQIAQASDLLHQVCLSHVLAASARSITGFRAPSIEKARAFFGFRPFRISKLGEGNVRDRHCPRRRTAGVMMARVPFLEAVAEQPDALNRP